MKVAVITGAASGIGLALCKIYLEKAVKVVMVDINYPKLQAEADKFASQFPEQVVAIPCDISNQTAVNLLAGQIKKLLGRVDWIYNNAGIMGDLAPIWEQNTESIHRVLNVNLYGMIYIIQEFSPLLFSQNFNSHIVNMASFYALCTGSNMSAYSMSKHAVLALSESLYFDLKRLNKPVDVSVVFPSFTDTDLVSNTGMHKQDAFYESLKSLLTHSKQALDVAQHIVQAVDNKQFYILPDREVKVYCEERVRSIILQEKPHVNNIEKLMNSLINRTRTT